jgi:hypothetical protein
MRRYLNQARPSSVSFPDPAASEFCNSASTNCNAAKKEEDPNYWQEFHNFLLQRMNERSAEDRLRYAKQYRKTLQTANASDLLHLKPDKRIHAMKALSNLAKFTGKYDVWLQLRQRCNLKWTSGNESLQSFERFFNDELSLDTMLRRVDEMMHSLPSFMAQIVKFACLTGLRPAEAVESVRLINDKEAFPKYYNPKPQALEHFRFPDIFLRQTKKAYISL